MIAGIFLAFGVNAIQRTFNLNTGENCPIGPVGTYPVSDPTASCGISWQPAPFLVSVIPPHPISATNTTASAGSLTVILRSGYKLASTTITNTAK